MWCTSRPSAYRRWRRRSATSCCRAQASSCRKSDRRRASPYNNALNRIDRRIGMAKVAFLGLGVMGYPMAGYLAKNGHEVTVYNRTRAKADAWVAKHGGKAAATPKAAAQGAAIVFSCVGDDPDLRAVTVGADGAFESMAAGSIYVDHTTASANIARELFAVA